ncbi:MAG: VCBS repeat-containing protein, partial [Gimesia sp.]
MLNRSWKVTSSRLFVGFTGMIFFVMPMSVFSAEKINLAQYYGFKPLEIFKLSSRSSNMLSKDMNADGLNDLVLIDNSHSRIDLLLQKSGKDKQTEEEPEQPVNSIPNDARFKHVKVPVDVSVTALTVGDFNNDGRNDLAYLALPDRLIIRYQSESGG